MRKYTVTKALSPSRLASFISLSYAFFASFLILFSEKMFISLVESQELLHQIQSYKSFIFISISGVFLYLILQRKLSDVKRSASSYLAVFDSISEPALLHNRQSGQILDINKAASKLFDLSKKEGCERTVKDLNLELLEPLDQPQQLTFVPYLRQTHNKSGESFWVEVSSQLLNLESEQLVVSIVKDITFQKLTNDIFRSLAATSSLSDDDIYKTLAEEVATSFNIRCVLIGVVNQLDNELIDSIALWDTDRFIENIQYLLPGTPCEDVISKRESCWYSDKLCELFPYDSLIKDLAISSYLGVPIKNSDGGVVGIMCVLDDKPMQNMQALEELLNTLALRAGIEIERSKHNEKIKLSSRIFHDSQEGILITNTKGQIVDVNPTFCSVTGYKREEVIGENPRILSSGKQSDEFYDDMWRSLSHRGYWQGEISNRKKSGELYIELLRISSLKNDSGIVTNYVAIFTDITHYKNQQSQLELMAHYDVLTKLPNRILFADRFKQAAAQSQRNKTYVAVCFLDVDNFKPVNDIYGHAVGDQLLIDISTRIKNSIREEDTLSRQGGDEFTILLVNLESAFHVEKMLYRVLTAVSKPYNVHNNVIEISASIGITLYPDDDHDLDTLLRHADNAMYQAKIQGRDKYHFFNIEDDKETINKQKLIEEIRTALDSEQFSLYYQPKVNMLTGEVVGAEALIRWQHPIKGLIPPLDFLPSIQGHDIEVAVGKWVLQQAMQQLEQWILQGVQLEISVNISCMHLLSDDFSLYISHLFNRYTHVGAHNLQIEVLESSVLTDIDKISAILKSSQEQLNITFALDDFGTGYSSLTHLRELPVNTVKIDQSFVKDMLSVSNDYAIVNGVIALAHSYELDVIAEGVESTEHGSMLLMMGCELAQGYGIAKPMPADKFLAWLIDYEPNLDWKECSLNNLSAKQKQVKILRMSLAHWLNAFKASLANNDDKVPAMLDSTKCLCTAWIKREKHSLIFDITFLEQLERLHEKQHNIAIEIYNASKEEQSSTAQSMLPKLDAVVEEMNDLLIMNQR